jgi:hypothetical protein
LALSIKYLNGDVDGESQIDDDSDDTIKPIKDPLGLSDENVVDLRAIQAHYSSGYYNFLFISKLSL